MKYVSTEGMKGDTATRRLASLRTSMGKDEVRFDSDWHLHAIRRKRTYKNKLKDFSSSLFLYVQKELAIVMFISTEATE